MTPNSKIGYNGSMASFIRKSFAFVAYITKRGVLIARKVRTADFARFGDALAEKYQQLCFDEQ